MKLRDLETNLQQVSVFENPKVRLEPRRFVNLYPYVSLCENLAEIMSKIKNPLFNKKPEESASGIIFTVRKARLLKKHPNIC